MTFPLSSQWACACNYYKIRANTENNTRFLSFSLTHMKVQKVYMGTRNFKALGQRKSYFYGDSDEGKECPELVQTRT